MINDLRKQLKESLESYFVGNINKHKMNVEVYMRNPAGIGEHPDVLEAIESEIEKISEYEDKLDILRKYFN